MFPLRFFPKSCFAGRYWPPATPAGPPVVYPVILFAVDFPYVATFPVDFAYAQTFPVDVGNP